tara:strand:+ start:180 stop:443 length:264 start_codon:yes stop_codon:yes gene_type:complete
MNETQHLIAIQTRLERIERLLKEKQKDNTLMTIIEAANFTRLGTTTLRRAIYAGNLDVVSGGGTLGGCRKIIINKFALITWLENRNG